MDISTAIDACQSFTDLQRLLKTVHAPDGASLSSLLKTGQAWDEKVEHERLIATIVGGELGWEADATISRFYAQDSTMDGIDKRYGQLAQNMGEALTNLKNQIKVDLKNAVEKGRINTDSLIKKNTTPKIDAMNHQVDFAQMVVGAPFVMAMAGMVGAISWGGILSVASLIPVFGGIFAGINFLCGLVKLGILFHKQKQNALTPEAKKQLIMGVAQAIIIGLVVTMAIVFATSGVALLVASCVLGIANIINGIFKNGIIPKKGADKKPLSSVQKFKYGMFAATALLAVASITAAALSVAGAAAVAAIAGPIGIIIAALMVLTAVIFMVHKRVSANKENEHQLRELLGDVAPPPINAPQMLNANAIEHGAAVCRSQHTVDTSKNSAAPSKRQQDHATTITFGDDDDDSHCNRI